MITTAHSTAPRLGPQSLPDNGVHLPTFDRTAVTSGIIHIGVGGFHRAHQALVMDNLLARGDHSSWGITGMGVMPVDARMRDALTEQGGLYTLVEKHPDGRRDHRVIGSIRDVLLAPDNPGAAVEAMADPQIRIVSLTITEGGYNFNQSTGLFDPSTPAVAHDIEAMSVETAGDAQAELDRTPAWAGDLQSVFGLVVGALKLRWMRGLAPFTVMSCDNIQGNGDTAARQFGAFAEYVDPELAEWIRHHVPFPNSMVDRITPVTSDEDRARVAEETGRVDAWPVVCEPFFQWVLEDRFVTDADGSSQRPAFEEAGVQMVDDVEPYELMKLRLLNASHQALCYPGRLAGLQYAHEVCTDPLYVAYLMAYMEQEATPTLQDVPGIDLDDYRRTLIERFANPQVRDTLARLCAESSDRIPKWVVPVIQDNLAAGRAVDLSAAIVASWARYAQGVDEAGADIEIVDPRRDTVMKAAADQNQDPLAFVRNRELFGDLADQEAFVEPYLWALESFRRVGARATLTELLSRVGRPLADGS